MQYDNADECRKAAAEFLELAKHAKNPRAKHAFLTMFQEWLKRAYLRESVNLDNVIADFNERQMNDADKPPPVGS
jgi:hypothetical protein